MKKYFVGRNARRFIQVRGSLFTIESLQPLIRSNSYTPFSEKNLQSKAKLNQLNLSQSTKNYVNELKRNNEIMSNIKQKIIPLPEYKQGYKIWKEGKTTSPSSRHLGHHNALLAPDGVHYDDSNTDFADTMWNIHNNITNIALLNEKSLSQ